MLCFGDSITFIGYGGTTYCQLLAQLRPDLKAFTSGIPGEGTANGVERLKSILKNQPKGYYDYLVILEGVNDPLFINDGPENADPITTGKRLRHMARNAVMWHGIQGAYILTLTPSTKYRNTSDFDFQQFTGDVSAWLLENGGKLYNKVQVPDLRTAISPNWFSEYSDDGDHPNLAGRQFIAEFLAGVILAGN